MQNLMGLLRTEENPSTLMCLILCITLLIPLAPVEITSCIKVKRNDIYVTTWSERRWRHSLDGDGCL